jgi:tetratricopeptide (TPR) repeat protein
MVRAAPVFALLLSGSALAATPEQIAAALALREAGRPAEAQAALEQLAAAEPRNPEVNYQLGVLAYLRDDTEAAIRHLETALSAAPGEARYHYHYGHAQGRSAQKSGVFSKFGHARKCLAAYERAVALAPDVAEFRESLFEFYRQAPAVVGGGRDKAVAQAEAILRLDPPRGRVVFATLYVGEGKLAEAFAPFEEALQTSPDDYFSLYHLGRLAAVTGHAPERGLACLRRCLELTPPAGKDVPGHAYVQWRLGQLQERRKDPAAARVAFTEAVRLDPTLGAAVEALRRLRVD